MNTDTKKGVENATIRALRSGFLSMTDENGRFTIITAADDTLIVSSSGTKAGK